MTGFIRVMPGLLTVAAGALLTCGSVDAATQSRNHMQNASGTCQAALPAFEGQVRKRPLALQNEGTSNAFVTCSLLGSDSFVGGTSGIKSVYIGLINNTASAISVTCTLVDGFAYLGSANTYVTKSISVPATNRTQIGWTATDNGGQNYRYVGNTSCNLPVGTGINYTFVYYDEEVGA